MEYSEIYLEIIFFPSHLSYQTSCREQWLFLKFYIIYPRSLLEGTTPSAAIKVAARK